MFERDGTSGRRHAPATERNREPLLEVLAPRVRGRVLEVASGTGQHARYFAERLPVIWQPTDPDPANLESITAWREGGPDGLLAPFQLDVHDLDWRVGELDAVLAVNLIHISPWSATDALFAGAARHVVPGGRVLTYGPYRVDGAHTSESNERFEGWLLSLDPGFGVRDMGEVAEVAGRHGFTLAERLPMPANNFTLVFEKA
ncbi:MAG: DUF938 domain-containing protein [Alphaproteobacteria bacterium]|nr:DUF938 domain-containing protein [Alphaproteobacteria bacterium]MCB9690314.1 DUF938 domain-containing protein [Alphaproteobacteria bacterium]